MKTVPVRLLMLALVCLSLRHATLARTMTTVSVRQERQKEIERQIRENERRQNELRRLRQEEETATEAEWLQYLEQLRASNLEIRAAIEQERRRLDNSCCATLEDGTKCENAVYEGGWFCFVHKDPPRNVIDEPILSEVEAVPEPLVANAFDPGLRNEGKKTIGRKRSMRRLEDAVAEEKTDGDYGERSAVWIVVVGGSVLCVVFLWVLLKLSPAKKNYATKRINKTGKRT